MAKNINVERVVRDILIALTFISIVIVVLNFTYLTYQNNNILLINSLLVNFVNKWLLLVDNILLFIFAIIYIVLAVKSKTDLVLKVSFSIFSIITSMISLTAIINVLARLFKII